jgi:hypothetical protein
MSGRKGFIFSLDAIFAVAVIVIAIAALASIQRASILPSGKQVYLSTISRDAVTILEKTRISEARAIPRINEYILNGTIKAEDLDKRLIDIIGSLYAGNNITVASDILSSIFSGFLPARMYYEILINNQTLLLNNKSHTTAIVTRSVVSGYLSGKPTSGYISRAWLGSARGNVTDLIEISPLGSGFSEAYSSYHGNLTFTKYFNLSSVDNLTAKLALSLHEESGWVYVYINNAPQQIPSGNDCYHPTDACYSKITLNSSSFVVGQNSLKAIVGQPGNYHTHTHPGFLLTLNYNDNRQTNFVQGSEVTERLNLTDVDGRPSAWETMPFNIPAGAKINKITMYVKGEGVDRYGEIWINSNRVWYNTSSSCSSCMTALNGGGITKDVTRYANNDSNGFSTGSTNTIAVYLDIPASGSVDYPVDGAANFANISGNSYVFLNYTIANPITKFNYVPYTQVFEIDNLDGAGDALTKSANFTIPNTTLISAYYHDVQKYSYLIAIAAWKPPTEAPPSWQDSPNYRWSNYQIFKSPDARNIPGTIYIPLTRLQAGGLNSIKMRDGFNGGSSENYIMGNSTVEYTILVPASVPYGDAFSNLSAASDDAKARLQAALAPYNITGTPASDTANIAGISWLWGPSELKVVIGT